MGRLRLKDVESDCACLRAARPDTMPDRLPGILGQECLELALGPFMLGVGLARPQVDAGEFGPAVGAAHVHHPDRLDARSGRLDPEQPWRLAAFDTTPELFL